MSKTSLNFLPQLSKTNPPFFILLLLTVLHIPTINCKTCKESLSFSETDCFNNILQINTNGRNYRAGHFVINKNGDLIIEFSGDPPTDYRLFYALKKNGRGYFNDNTIKEKQLIKTGNAIGRFESRNIMVHLYDNYDVEYIFSTSAYASASELHDLENDAYRVADTDTFLGNRIFSYVYNILEAKENGKTIYFIFFTTPENNPSDNNGGKFILKKMKFPEFKLDYSTSHINSQPHTNFNGRAICGFLFEDNNAFGVMYIHPTDKTYVVRLFNYALNEIGSKQKLYNDQIPNVNDISGSGRYLQAVYLKDNVVAFFYFHQPINNNIRQLKLQVLHFSIWSNGFSFSDRLFIDWGAFSLNDEIFLNDIYKIDNNTLAFASTASNSNQKLYILLLDFYNDYKSMKTRYYSFGTTYVLNKELQLYSYNNFLLFTSTINYNNYNSILLFFGYPNGTDFEITLSPYIQNADEYSSSYNFFKTLNDTLKVENNIFGYRSTGKIKLLLSIY